LKFDLQLFGLFNAYNAILRFRSRFLKALAKAALEKVSGVPGRMEFIRESANLKVLVDYAPEPDSLKQCYRTIHDHGFLGENGKLIHVLGSCGGGRDTARRPIMGEMAGKEAAYVIVTNEDPYDDDPQVIIDQVAAGAERQAKN
jgi:UDP-N-acetylmuramoyl-L-alanyl-D-glutamate--2,6-diaminopimelate ligase